MELAHAIYSVLCTIMLYSFFISMHISGATKSLFHQEGTPFIFSRSVTPLNLTALGMPQNLLHTQ